MRIAIIEDENYWRENTEKIVRKYYGVKELLEIDVYENGEDYLNSKTYYDISLVDIEMPGIDGFETISRARQYNCDGIFIILTTHLELSRRGYVVKAFRYIDKANFGEEIEEAMKSAEIVLGRNKKISVNVIGVGQQELVLKDIMYIETEKHHILVHTTHGNLKCDNSMHDIEEHLEDKWFYRSHNSYIVNLDEVKSFDSVQAIMSNGDKIYISQRKSHSFKRAYISRQYKCANA